ncbi:MAG: hypothetical protein IJA48_00205 [Oscillospiraceae bacterium]|nr:hypothetical protein [Oscillospiraceae bacterium]
MKRSVLLILAVVLILGCLVGCRRKDSTVSTDPNGMIGNSEPSTQKPLPPTTEAPTTEASTQATTRPTESTEMPVPSDSRDQESSSTEDLPGESGSEDSGVNGRSRRTRPLFR